MSELKPCPFCGCEGEQVSDGDDGYFIRCSSGHCDAWFGITMTAREWNTRPIEDALNARIAELEAAQRRTKGCDGLEIVMTKQMQKMIDKELKKRFEELKPELATRYEELLNMRNMEADQFNDGFNDARAGKLETDQPHYDLDTDNWRLGYAWGMFELMKKEKLARERQVSDAEINELGAQESEVQK